MNQEQAFEQLITQLLSSDNTVRNNAQQQFERICEQQPEFVVISLLKIACHHRDEAVKVVGVQMLRSVLINPTNPLLSQISRQAWTPKAM